MEHHLHALAEAARTNDAIADEHGMSAAARIIGLDFEAVMHVADQRAMRAALVTMRGEEMARSLSRTDATIVHLTPKEREMVGLLMPVYIDGIYLGWRAHEIHQNDGRT